MSTNTAKRSMDELVDAVLAAVEEIAHDGLGARDFQVRSQTAALPPDATGALIPMTDGEDRVQIGMLSTGDGCQALAGALAGSLATDETSPVESVTDAMCEIVNLVAGAMKRHLFHGSEALEVGLPHSVAAPSLPETDLVVAEVVLAGTTAHVVVAREP